MRAGGEGDDDDGRLTGVWLTGGRHTGHRALVLALACVFAGAACGGDDQVDVTGPTLTTSAPGAPLDPAAPEPNAPGTVVPFDAANVGDCWSAVEAGVTEYEVVDCNDFHDYEVHAVFTLPDGAYPGDEAMADAADAGCRARFAAYVGTPVEESVLFTEPLYPGEEGWARGERTVVCSIVDPAGAAEGSAFDARL